MTVVTDPVRNAILAVLQLAKDEGIRGLTRTALVKMVYLLDLASAQDGKPPYSRQEWRFLSYGPYSQAVAEGIDTLATQGALQSRSGQRGDRDFMVYWLGEYPQGPSLETLGLSVNAANRYRNWTRSFASDLQKLLDFVYFRTAPMISAHPFDILNFDIATDLTESQSAKVRVRDPKVMIELRRLFNNLGQAYLQKTERTASPPVHRPIHDAEYYRAMFSIEEADEDGTIDFSARIN